MNTNGQFDTDWLDELDDPKAKEVIKEEASAEAYDNTSLGDTNAIDITTTLDDKTSLDTRQLIVSQENLAYLERKIKELSSKGKIDRRDARDLIHRGINLTYGNENFYTLVPSTTCFKATMEDLENSFYDLKEEANKHRLKVLDDIRSTDIKEVLTRINQEFNNLKQIPRDKEISVLVIESDINELVSFVRKSLSTTHSSLDCRFSIDAKGAMAPGIHIVRKTVTVDDIHGNLDIFKKAMVDLHEYSDDAFKLVNGTIPREGTWITLASDEIIAVWDGILGVVQSYRSAYIG